MAGGMCGRKCVSQEACVAGACMAEGHAWQGAGEMAAAVDGTHPTGMHSCCMEKIPKTVDEKPALNK